MNKTIFAVCVIFMMTGQYTARYASEQSMYQRLNYAKYSVEQQLYKQQAMVQNLQVAALGAAAGAFNPKDIVDTVNGLSDAVKYWGTFIGNEVFDAAYVNTKITELQARRADLEKYASTTGAEAVKRLNLGIWEIDTSVKAIQSLATQLRSGSKNVMTVSNIALMDGNEMLTGTQKQLYEGAINVLVNTLTTANDNAADIRDRLDALSKEFIGIQSEMGTTKDRLRKTAEGKSEEFKQWRDDIRAKCYGGCAASIILGPAILACEGTCAIVLETVEIPKYKREVEAYVREFTSWADTFEVLETMAGQAAAVAKEKYMMIVDFKDIIQADLDFISGVSSVLYISAALRTEVDKTLTTLIAECDKVINDAKGRLESNAAATQAAAKKILMEQSLIQQIYMNY